MAQNFIFHLLIYQKYKIKHFANFLIFITIEHFNERA